MAPSTADPEGEDFTDDYITSRQRWLAIGFGGVVAGLIASGVGILWNEHQIWFRSWCGGMLLCNLILLGLLIFLRKALSPPSSIHKAQALRYSLLGVLALIILVAPATLAYFTYSKGIILDVKGAYKWVPWMCAGPQLIPVSLAITISLKLWNVRTALMGKGPSSGAHLLEPLAPSRRASTRRTLPTRTARPHSSSGTGSSAYHRTHGENQEFPPSDDSAIEQDHRGSSSHVPKPRHNAAEYSSGSATEPGTQHNPLHHPVRRVASARHLDPNSTSRAPVVLTPSGVTGHDFAYDPPVARTRSLSMSKKHRSYSSEEESD